MVSAEMKQSDTVKLRVEKNYRKEIIDKKAD